MIRPLPFGLNSCMTQQNKGVSKTFYKERSTWYLLSYFTLITQNHSNEKRSLNFLLCLTPASLLPHSSLSPPSPSLSPSLSPPPSLALPSLSRCLSPPSRSLPSLSRSPLPLSLSLPSPLSLSLSPLSLPLYSSPPLPLSLSPSPSLSAPPSLSLPKLMHTRAVRISVFSGSHHT